MQVMENISNWRLEMVLTNTSYWPNRNLSLAGDHIEAYDICIECLEYFYSSLCLNH